LEKQSALVFLYFPFWNHTRESYGPMDGQGCTINSSSVFFPTTNTHKSLLRIPEMHTEQK
jgi:hypothetical protein